MSKVILHTIIDIHSIRREAIIYRVKREAMKLDNGQQGHLNVFPLNALIPLLSMLNSLLPHSPCS